MLNGNAWVERFRPKAMQLDFFAPGKPGDFRTCVIWKWKWSRPSFGGTRTSAFLELEFQYLKHDVFGDKTWGSSRCFWPWTCSWLGVWWPEIRNECDRRGFWNIFVQNGGGVKRVWIYMFCKYNLYIYILYVLMLQSGYTCFFVPDHVWMLQCHDVFGFLKRWPWFHQSNTPCSNSLGLESGYVDTSVKGWRSCVCSCHVFEKYQQQIHRWEFGVQFHVRNTHTPTWQRTESAEHGHHHTWAGDSITRNVPRNLYSLETWKLETTHIPSTQVGVLSVEVLVLFDYKI